MIKIESLNKKYTVGKHTVTAVKNISFEVNSPLFISVMGKSGSGKSTLLHLIGGLETPDSGTIHIDGEDITVMKERELSAFRMDNIGFVFQFFNLVPELTAEENILFPVTISKNKLDKKHFKEIVSLLDIEGRLNHLPGELSGGELQRVAIARSLILKPKLLLMDEPTGNLDSVATQIIVRLLSQVNKTKKQTIIVVTHDTQVASAADIMLTIQDGFINNMVRRHG